MVVTDEESVPVSATDIATRGKQDTGNASLASIDAKLPQNSTVELLASTAIVITGNTATITNANNKGAIFVIDVTALAGGATVTPKLQMLDTVSGKWIDLATLAAIAATSTVSAIVYPGAAGTITAALPYKYRWVYTLAGASATLSISANYLN